MCSIPMSQQASRHRQVLMILTLLLSAQLVFILRPANILAAPSTRSGPANAIDILGAGAPPGYSPDVVTLHVGDQLTFHDADQSSSAGHVVVANDGAFQSPVLSYGQSWTLTVGTEGVHEFHDRSAPQGMVGVIFVVPQSVTLLPTPAPNAEATALAAANVNAALTQPQSQPASVNGVEILLIGLVVLALTIAGILYIKRRHS